MRKAMISEGDRSGIPALSKADKALNLLKASHVHISMIDSQWRGMTPQRRAVAISEVRSKLALAVTILMGEDGDT